MSRYKILAISVETNDHNAFRCEAADIMNMIDLVRHQLDTNAAV